MAATPSLECPVWDGEQGRKRGPLVQRDPFNPEGVHTLKMLAHNLGLKPVISCW